MPVELCTEGAAAVLGVCAGLADRETQMPDASHDDEQPDITTDPALA